MEFGSNLRQKVSQKSEKEKELLRKRTSLTECTDRYKFEAKLDVPGQVYSRIGQLIIQLFV